MKKILLICLFAAAVAFAADTNLTITVDGVTYRNVRFQSTNEVSVTLFHSTGVATIPLKKLSPELQRQLGYDPQRAALWEAAQQKAAAEAAEAQRKTAATVGWKLTIESVMVDGVIARGCKTTKPCPHPVSIFLIEHPQLNDLAEGNEITATAYKDGVATVGNRTLEKWVYYQPVMPQHASPPPPAPIPAARERNQEQPQTVPPAADAYVPELRVTGAFGFPQGDARVLCNRPALHFSVWSNNQYLFAQAVLWKDDDSSVGKDADGNPLGDYSHLMLDLDDDGKETPGVDRVYRLNQRPYTPGLHHAICMGSGGTTGDRSDSAGRGAIRYVETSTGKRVRVDTYLIPLAEISKRVGDKIGLCYYAYSPKPHFVINSVTFDTWIPRNKFQEYHLTVRGASIDVTKVPEGREDTVASQHE